MTVTVTHNEPFIDVTRGPYNARGDGITDDTEAIQRAIDAAEDAGGGIIVFPQGHYLVDDTTTASGNTWALLIKSDNIAIDLAPGAILETTQDAAVIAALGGAKPSGGAAWFTNHFTAATVYPTSSIAKGAWSITTTTPAHAGNFVAGDWIVLRTGQTIDTLDFQPDAEINRVDTVNAGTGVMTLRYATSKPYAQEYFVSGTAGRTTTSVTANAAPFGVAKVTDRLVHNFSIKGGTIRGSRPVPLIGGLFLCRQIVGFSITDCILESTCVLGNCGTYRDMKFLRNIVRTDRASASAAWWGADTGCSDVEIAHNDVTCTQHDYLHIHEGASRLNTHDNVVRIANTDGINAVVSVRARAYDIAIHDNHFSWSGTAVDGVYVDDLCTDGGSVRDNTFIGSTGSNAVWIGAPNWQVSGNRPDTANVVSYNNATGLTPTGGSPAQRQMVSSVWVADNDQNPTIAILPPAAVIDRVTIYVHEAFNSSGTNLISVGIDASPQAFAVTTDVSTTGVKTVAPASVTGYPFAALGGTLTIEAYYTNGGTEPTTGKALVDVFWHIAAWVVA